METYQTLFFILLGILCAFISVGFWYVQQLKKRNALEQQELMKATTTKNRLFYILEQEMRKPILVFRDLSKKIDFLVDQKEYETLKRLGQQLDKEAVSLNLLFENLLIWAKKQKNNLPYNPKPISSKQIIEEINQTFLPLAQEKTIEFSSSFSESAHVNADLDSIMLLLKNILYQIIQEANPKQTIQVVLTPQEQDNQININISGLESQSILQKSMSNQSTLPSTNQGTFDPTFNKELILLNRGSFQFFPTSIKEKSLTFQLSFPRA